MTESINSSLWAHHASPVDSTLLHRIQRRLDQKTKPERSLGRLEAIACQFGAIRGTESPDAPRAALVVMAADHGIATEQVSAYPQAVTEQMVLNFARGGAAINVLSRLADAELTVIDMGTCAATVPEGVLDRRIASGTQNFLQSEAMTADQARQAIETGIGVASKLAEQGYSLVGLGEMGIGNSTSAAALTVALTGARVEDAVGRGTGVSDEGLALKKRVVELALRRHAAAANDPLQAAICLGGFEILGLCGLVLGAAQHRMGVVLDGFIASVAGLLAWKLSESCREYCFASHRSVEIGHAIVLEFLDLRPLLDLELRLGEGTGAALAMPLIRASVALLSDMATFESAGVAEKS